MTRDFTSLYFLGRCALLFASILFITASHLFGVAVDFRVAFVAGFPAADVADDDKLTALAVGDGTVPTVDDVVDAVDAGRWFS